MRREGSKSDTSNLVVAILRGQSDEAFFLLGLLEGVTTGSGEPSNTRRAKSQGAEHETIPIHPRHPVGEGIPTGHSAVVGRQLWCYPRRNDGRFQRAHESLGDKTETHAGVHRATVFRLGVCADDKTTGRYERIHTSFLAPLRA